MKVLIFDLVGKMGHFRKLDTNSSSLSYSFPPRTTLIGLLAGILGMERDEYYERFSPEKCDIGISIRTPIRKLMQTVNYMFVKSKSDLNNSKGHTQIPIEFILPSGKDKNLRYRIYFSHTDESIYGELKQRIQLSRFIYPPYLGLSELLGHIEWIGEADGTWQNSQEAIRIDSISRISDLQERSLEFSKTSRYVKEFMTRHFTNERMIHETDYYLFEKSRNTVAIPIHSYLSVEYGEEKENVLFL
jgi:CRISPR-associated protein Cas5h